MYPVANQRLLVFGFKGSPEVSLDYKIFIGANETHKLNIGAVLPIRSIVENLFKVRTATAWHSACVAT